ncbi:MAG: M28 family peptidase [Flavobacteriales bacterium]|nr:M28 family peptidase [Flavobacteriales bacterium]
MKQICVIIFFYGFIGITNAQVSNYDVAAIKFANTINSDDLRNLVYFLAGDSCAGRETGKLGQKVAANYIARYFKKLGLIPVVNDSYFQQFPLESNPKTEITVYHNSKKVESSGIFFLHGFKNYSIQLNDAVFAGYGIQTQNYNSYDNLHVKNKAVFILYGEPKRNGESIIVPGKQISEWSSNFRKKISLAEKLGASVVFLIINDNEFNHTVRDIAEIASEYDLEQYYNPNHIPYLFIKESLVKKILGIKGNLMNSSSYNISNVMLQLKIITNYDTLYGENILGLIEGTDLKNEIIVITAHYDHLGTHHGKTYYGADDDGSGTAAILEIAEAFAEARKSGYSPRRSILIMPVSGEEKGLLGSAYYVNNPVFPLQNTIANLNIDMIGRVDANHTGNSNYVYLIGSDKLSSELHQISENVNSTYTKLTLDYTFNDPNDPNMFYYRSDHYNFAKNNIPVIFYFTGIHDDYHKPTDTPEKLDYEKIEKIARLVFYTAWDLANRDKRPIVDKINEFKNRR